MAEGNMAGIQDFIKNTGFPILAFLLMFYLYVRTVDKLTCAMDKNTSALITFATASESFREQVTLEHNVGSRERKEILLECNR